MSDVKDLASSIEKLKLGQAQVIAKSPGGRPIHLVAFGEREAVRHRANFNSAVGGQDLSAYADKSARKKPVILFVGPVHGHEVEGLTGLMNLIQVMEMGRDLRKGTVGAAEPRPALPIAHHPRGQSRCNHPLRAPCHPRHAAG